MSSRRCYLSSGAVIICCSTLGVTLYENRVPRAAKADSPGHGTRIQLAYSSERRPLIGF